MARWGEGDPRWIVEERPDAKNVNNWHWTEKNACSWSTDKLKSLLVGAQIDSDLALVKLTDLDKIEGDAYVNNRKGKLIFFYEWVLTLTWKGKLVGASSEHEGKIQIPNLSEENDMSEVEVLVTLKESNPEGEIIKDFLHHRGCEQVREKLQNYVDSLKQEFTKGMILPKKESEESKDKEQINNLSSGFTAKVQMNNYVSSSKAASSSIATDTLEVSQSFQCRGEDFFLSLTDPEMVSKFTMGPCLIEAREGGKFELLNKNILGEFVELVKDKKIVQRWRLRDWPENHFSTVTFVIDQQEDHTVVKITQTGIPKSELDITRENWARYYWDSMKRVFGWGYFM
ncbi:hypothetical protein GE061_011906 [Apolygus lucorum]|uniref:Activator of Hsp90 ATPase AHSA1-like N-terminal domain-containing protein n=1 Tax=Apolygus lucorum TaxID=248454 RepID=A0A8S9XRZ6_APOLU|nr:hypothetical protein GE061_011906 [Apolygus lucorum]